MKNKVVFVNKGNYELVKGTGKIDLPYHTHKSYTLVLISAGSLIACVNGINQKLDEGMMIVLPPNNGISMTHLGEYSYISLTVYSEACEKLQEYMPIGFIKNDESGKFEQFLDGLKDELSDEDLVEGLKDAVGLDNVSSKKPKPYSAIVLKAIEYMDSNVRADFTIEQMAEELNVSREYLSRVFKKEMCITPKQYMIQNRLRQVKRQLEDTDNETALALDNGFAAESHLCTTFKKYMGVSITEYKKSINV